MLLLYRMLVLMSSPTNRPLTRVETLEAFHKYVLIKNSRFCKEQSEPGEFIVVTKTDFFDFLQDMDRLISSVSFEERWRFLCEELPYNCGGNVFADSYKFQLRKSYLEGFANKILMLIQSKQPQIWDDHDEKLPRQETQHGVATTGILKEMIERDNAILARLNGINDAVLALAQSVSEATRLNASMRRDITGSQIVSIDPQQLEKLVAMAAITTAEEEPRRLTMSEKITKAAIETGTGVVSAMQEGLKISVSQQSAKKIVQLFHQKLGHHIPGASTPLGQKAEEIMIPAFVHFTASALSDKIPKAEFVQRACLRAITGTSKDSGDELLEMLLPLFNEIISMETMSEVAQQFTGELAITGQRPVSLEGVESKSLSAALAQQLREIPEGEEFEIVIRRPKAQTEEKPLFPSFPERSIDDGK
jgi:hypothetical protein